MVVFDVSMPKGTTQIIFECPEAFRKRLYEEKLKRRMSIKRMIMEAVEERWFPRRSEPDEIINFTIPGPYLPDYAHWADMFVEYMERCPAEKVKLLQSVIKQDLRVYKSKRRTGRTKEW